MNLIVSLYLAAFSFCFIAQANAIEILFRYDLDNDGFFNQPGAKEALEAAAQFYEDLIVDELDAIDPGSSFLWHPTYLEPNTNSSVELIPGARNLVVPANTLVIFAAGRNLSPSSGLAGPGAFDSSPANLTQNINWFNTLLSRGEPGATTFSGGSFTTPSDFAPWGGSAFFDQSREWNFSTTEPSPSSGNNFLTVALHELGHILGIGIRVQQCPWLDLVNINTATFEGPLAASSNGGQSPDLNPFQDHWQQTIDSSNTLAVFGRKHGEEQTPLMTPSLVQTDSGQFQVPTDLDIVALRDLGWELADTPTPEFRVSVDLNDSEPNLAIPTTTGTQYQVMRGSSPESLAEIGPLITGDGTIQSWPDSIAMTPRAFYQVEIRSGTPTPKNVTSTNTADSKSASKSAALSRLPEIKPVQCSCYKHSKASK